jgi:FtsZ-interacting cell division protein ZipA
MTELNIAYSYNGNEMMDDKQSEDMMLDYQQPQQQPQQPQQQPQQQQPQQQVQPQVQLQPQQLAPINNSYYLNQPQQQPQIIKKQQVYQQRNPEYSFWDRMVLSRNDVFKLVLLAFVIVLGISIFSIGNHYLNQYLSDNILSSTQEFIVRISYPILIFILLWIIKSL